MAKAGSPGGDGAVQKCDRRRVLIVDDESAIRDVFKLVVSYGIPDCRIDLAVNGAEAIDSFRAAHQGIILMDLHMPVMDGAKAFVEMRKLCESEGVEMPSVVFCTGYEPPSLVREAVRDNPAHELLRKPVANDTLIDVIKSKMGG